jgi:hypothetical protein
MTIITVHSAAAFDNGTVGESIALTSDDPTQIGQFVLDQAATLIGVVDPNDGHAVCDALDITVSAT